MRRSNPVPTPLTAVIDATDQVVAAIAEDQWSLPTPCAGWSVADLVNHLIGGNQLFGAALRGEAPAPSQEPTRSQDDLLEAYRRSVRSLLDAFSQPGALEKVVTVPFGTVPASCSTQGPKMGHGISMDEGSTP